MNFLKILFGCTLLMVSVCVPAAQVQEEAAATEFDPKAQAIFTKASDYVKGLKHLSFEAHIDFEGKVNGEDIKTSKSYEIATSRPDNMRVVIRSDAPEQRLTCDGKSLYVHVPDYEQYMTVPAPGQLERLIGGSFQHPQEVASLLVGQLMAKEPYGMFAKDWTKMSYSGEEEVDGQKCDRITMSAKDGITWDLWIDAGDTPLVRRITPDLNTIYADLFKSVPDAVLSVSAALTQWQTNTALPESTFGAPANAKLVTELKAPPLATGIEAPTFTLDLMDGGKVNLADHRGKDIVILDFWATHCPPCRTAMPIVTGVATKLKDKGVVLYAVNSSETEVKIKPFLKQMKLDTTIALDTGGQVARQYKVSGIPTMVIIDKEGTIQAVHVGLSPNLEAELTEKLDALLAGKSLVEATG